MPHWGAVWAAMPHWNAIALRLSGEHCSDCSYRCSIQVRLYVGDGYVSKALVNHHCWRLLAKARRRVLQNKTGFSHFAQLLSSAQSRVHVQFGSCLNAARPLQLDIYGPRAAVKICEGEQFNLH